MIPMAWKTDRATYGIGLASFAVIGAMGLLIAFLSFYPFGATTYTAQLEHSAGLRSGEGVRVAGIEVGEIRSIELAGDHVNVDFTVDRDIELGRDTTVEVKVATLLGTHFLEVTPTGEGELPDGVVPMAQTHVAFNLQEILEEGTPRLQAYDEERIAKALHVVADTFRGTKQSSRRAMAGVTQLSNLIVKRDDQVARLLEASEKLSAEFAANTQDVLTLMREANVLIEEILNRRDTIRSLLRNTVTLSNQIYSTINDIKADAGPLLRDLETVIETYREQEKTLNNALKLMAPTSRYFANAGGNGPWIDLDANAGAVPDTLWCQSHETGCR